MPRIRPIFLCAFANDKQYSLSVGEEEGKIRRALQSLDGREDIEYKNIGQAKLADIFDSFENYDNKIYIFHYGGHSDQKGLDLNDTSLKAESLAGVLGRQKKLKLAFLNGCGNNEQVNILWKNGVRAIIATRAKIDDTRASNISERFYGAIAKGLSIGSAFDSAVDFVKNDAKIEIIKVYRGLDLDDTAEDSTFPWGLYVQDEAVLDWHIGMVEKEEELETLDLLRQASLKRYQRLTGFGESFKHLTIDEAILAGIQGVQTSGRALIDASVDLNGQPQSLLQSITEMRNAPCPHVMLVGSGGMGKTVSLLDLWKHFLGVGEEHTCVPVFIQLNEFNNKPKEDFIRNYILEYYPGVDIDLLWKASSSNTAEQIQPKVLLLLDGLNEVTADNRELLNEINSLKLGYNYPGVHMVLTSRVDLRASYQWQSFHLLELQDLSDAQIKAYLQKDLPRDPKLLELIRNPMMLSIYATQSELPKTYLDKGLLKEQVTSTGEMLFNVEVIQRIKIGENVSSKAEQFKQRFVLEHLLPYLGWTMQQAGAFYLPKESPGLLPLLAGLSENLLNRNFFLVFESFLELDREALARQDDLILHKTLIKEICCDKLCILVFEEENGSYRFLHQNFRDYFAARHVQNEIQKALYQKVFPEVLQKPLDFYVRQMLGELEGEHYNKPRYLEAAKRWSADHFNNDTLLAKLLDQCRGVFDQEQLGYTVWNILTIWVEQRGELSGANLEKLYYHPFNFNSKRLSRPGLAASFSKGLFLEDLFFSRGHKKGLIGAIFNKDESHILTTSWDNTAKVWDIKTGEHLFTLDGDSGPINSFSYSPNGEQIVIGSSDCTAKIWDAQKGQYLFTLEGHTSPVLSTAYSFDGRLIVTGSKFKAVKVWNAQTGECLFSLPLYEHDSKVVATFSPDGRQILTISDYSVQIWDAQNGKFISDRSFNFIKEGTAAYSPDGRRIITATVPNKALIWDANRKLLLNKIEGHSAPVNSITYSSKGRYIFTGSEDKKAWIWDAETGRNLLTVAHSGMILSTASSLDERFIVTCSMDDTAEVWDIQTGRRVLNIENPLKNELIYAAYGPKGRSIITASYYGVNVWDEENGKCLLNLNCVENMPNSLNFNLNGDSFLTIERNILLLWETKGNRCLLTFVGHTDSVTTAVFSKDSKIILTASKDHSVKTWDTKSGQELLTLKDHTNIVNGAVFSQDERFILSASKDKTAKLWSAKTGECKLTLKGHTDDVTVAIFSPDECQILTASRDHKVRLWGIQNGQCLLEFKVEKDLIETIAFSSDHTRIIICLSQTTQIWDIKSGLCLFKFQGAGIYNPNSDRILIRTYNNEEVSVFDALSGKLNLVLKGSFIPSFGINKVIFSPLGDRIFFKSNEKSGKVWDVQTGKCVLTLNEHFDGLSRVYYSPDGQRIVTHSNTGIKIWNAQTGGYLLTFLNSSGLFIQGCDFRNLHPDSNLSAESISLLRQYGGIFDDEDARQWEELMEKHFK